MKPVLRLFWVLFITITTSTFSYAETVYVKSRAAVLYTKDNASFASLYVPTSLEVTGREGPKVFVKLTGNILKRNTEEVTNAVIKVKSETPVFIWAGKEEPRYYYEHVGRLLANMIENSKAAPYTLDEKNDFIAMSIDGWVDAKDVTNNKEETETRGAIKGGIVKNGAPAEGVTVVINDIWKKTDKTGNYEFSNLVPGKEYILSIIPDEKASYKYIYLFNRPVLDPGENLVYDSIDLTSPPTQDQTPDEIIYDRGYVTVKNIDKTKAPQIIQYFSHMPFVISGVMKRPKQQSDKDVDEVKKHYGF